MFSINVSRDRGHVFCDFLPCSLYKLTFTLAAQLTFSLSVQLTFSLGKFSQFTFSTNGKLTCSTSEVHNFFVCKVHSTYGVPLDALHNSSLLSCPLSLLLVLLFSFYLLQFTFSLDAQHTFFPVKQFTSTLLHMLFIDFLYSFVSSSFCSLEYLAC
jgi:hypothetical protein